MIAAMAENRAIGLKDKIPWRIREDLIHFKEKTKGHAMIMGRKTFDSLLGYYERSGNPIPKRTNIILTRNKDYAKKVASKHLIEIFIADSIEAAISLAKQHEKTEIFIAGGARTFAQGIRYADKLYLTIVRGAFAGDAFFPEYSDFKKVVNKKESRNEKYLYTFWELERPTTSLRNSFQRAK